MKMLTLAFTVIVRGLVKRRFPGTHRPAGDPRLTTLGVVGGEQAAVVKL